MSDMLNIIEKLSPMLAGEELTDALKVLPEYKKDIRLASASTRLVSLNDIYEIYLPSTMSHEIYSKIYLATLRSLQKKVSKIAIIQRNNNAKIIANHVDYKNGGIVGGSDSFTIIGAAGIGKSASISRTINLISNNRIIEINKPYCKIVPIVQVQAPFDCSVKGLLLQILKEVDIQLETKYYDMSIRARATTDMLIGHVSQVALNHIGLLVVDEIQNVVNHRHGRSLIGCLTQLINNSGISICMVGVEESKVFFEQVNYLARRALGLEYTSCNYDDYFRGLCETLFKYQYVKNETSLSDEIVRWLYEHSGGVIAIVVSLIHDAQEISILDGREVLDLVSLNEAYEKRLHMMHEHIRPSIEIKKKASKKKKEEIYEKMQDQLSDEKELQEVDMHLSNRNVGEWSFVDLANQSKREHIDMIDLLKGKVNITELIVGV